MSHKDPNQDTFKALKKKDTLNRGEKLIQLTKKAELIKRKNKDKIQKLKMRSKKFKLFRKIASLSNIDKPFKSGEESYSLVDDKLAVLKNKLSFDHPAIIGEKPGYYLVSVDKFNGEGSKVVFNNRTKQYGVFTGIIKVKLYDFADRDSLFNNLAYTIEDSYDQIRVVHYRFDDYEQTISANSSLQNSTKVERSNIEVLEFERVTK